MRHLSRYIDQDFISSGISEDEHVRNVWLSICQDAADLSGADLTSFWLYNGDLDAIECVSSLDRKKERDVTGVVLSSKDYPRYFREINESSGIIANDAVRDLVTKEFAVGYFDVFGIVSLMDYVVRDDNNRPAAIICCENRDTQMDWTNEHINALRSLATLVQFHFKNADWLTHR